MKMSKKTIRKHTPIYLVVEGMWKFREKHPDVEEIKLNRRDFASYGYWLGLTDKHGEFEKKGWGAKQVYFGGIPVNPTDGLADI